MIFLRLSSPHPEGKETSSPVGQQAPPCSRTLLRSLCTFDVGKWRDFFLLKPFPYMQPLILSQAQLSCHRTELWWTWCVSLSAAPGLACMDSAHETLTVSSLRGQMPKMEEPEW